MKLARTASASLTRVAVIRDLGRAGMSVWKIASAIVAPCGNRQRFPNGDYYAQRTYRSPTGDQTPAGRSVGRRHLSPLGPFARLVSQLVAPLSSTGPQWTARTDARQRAAAS